MSGRLALANPATQPNQETHATAVVLSGGVWSIHHSHASGGRRVFGARRDAAVSDQPFGLGRPAPGMVRCPMCVAPHPTTHPSDPNLWCPPIVRVSLPCWLGRVLHPNPSIAHPGGLLGLSCICGDAPRRRHPSSARLPHRHACRRIHEHTVPFEPAASLSVGCVVACLTTHPPRLINDPSSIHARDTWNAPSTIEADQPSRTDRGCGRWVVWYCSCSLWAL